MNSQQNVNSFLNYDRMRGEKPWRERCPYVTLGSRRKGPSVLRHGRGYAACGHFRVCSGKSWRSLLDETGCVEVTDRSETVGLLLTPDYADDVSAYIAQLEAELEQAYVRTLFDMRRDYSEPMGGAALAAAALAEFDAREDKIREFLDGGE